MSGRSALVVLAFAAGAAALAGAREVSIFLAFAAALVGLGVAFEERRVGEVRRRNPPRRR